MTGYGCGTPLREIGRRHTGRHSTDPGIPLGEDREDPLPSRKYNTNVSRSGCTLRMMSCQKRTCRRTNPGTNWFPSPPASHIGASHEIRRRRPCKGSRVTSATDGHTPEAGRAPVRAHLRSSVSKGGVGRRTGRTCAWRRSRRRSQPSATIYSAPWGERGEDTPIYTGYHIAQKDTSRNARVSIIEVIGSTRGIALPPWYGVSKSLPASVVYGMLYHTISSPAKTRVATLVS